MPGLSEAVTVTPSTPTLKIHSFSESILGQQVFFRVLSLKGGFFIWVGTDDQAVLGNLSCAIKSSFDSFPSSTSLFGSDDDNQNSSLARKLSMKTKKQVFVSLNIPPVNLLLPLIEKRIVEEMRNNEAFFGC